MKKKIYQGMQWILPITMLVLGLTFPALSHAQSNSITGQKLASSLQFDPGNQISTKLGLGTADFKTTVLNITSWVLGLLGLISVVMMIIGGFIYMTSGGNDEKVRKAQALIKSALIGLIIVVLSYAIARFVFDAIQQNAR